MSEIFCGLAENLEGTRAGGMSQWARGHVLSWQVESAPPGFTVAQVEEIIVDGLETWAKVADVRFDKAAGRQPTNLIVYSKAIDGPRNILAQAQLPQVQQQGGMLTLQLDASERFILADNAPPGMIPIRPVVRHELGHNLGLGHAQAGSRNLMAPSLSDIQYPQPGFDIPQMIARMGEPRTSGGGTTQPPAGDLAGILRDLLAACDPQTLREAGELLRAANEAWRATR